MDQVRGLREQAEAAQGVKDALQAKEAENDKVCVCVCVCRLVYAVYHVVDGGVQGGCVSPGVVVCL